MLKALLSSLKEDEWKSGSPIFGKRKKINIDDAFKALRDRGYSITHAESTPSGAFYFVTDLRGEYEQGQGKQFKADSEADVF